ncbi:hypothetical protein BD770DRAFT_428854 [Pilaira anomala]|nr:hypothetical protein BD770DRAFT_428854 [Pilaira anomala]
MRRLLMDFAEFPEANHFDPFLYNDYDFIHSIVFHFLRLCESPVNPIGQKLRERSAATWSTFPIINYLFLQYQDLIELKWIEVLHDDSQNSKIDGLALKKKDMVESTDSVLEPEQEFYGISRLPEPFWRVFLWVRWHGKAFLPLSSHQLHKKRRH